MAVSCKSVVVAEPREQYLKLALGGHLQRTNKIMSIKIDEFGDLFAWHGVQCLVMGAVMSEQGRHSELIGQFIELGGLVQCEYRATTIIVLFEVT